MKRNIYIYGFISFFVFIFIFNPMAEKLVVNADELNNLQILKNDRSENGGIKEESQVIYDKSEAFLEDYTKQDSNKLELEVLDVIDDKLILLAINETKKPIKDISFELSIEGMFEKKVVESKQGPSGTLDAGNIYPIEIDLSEDELNKYEENGLGGSVEIDKLNVENVNKANFWKYYVLNLIFSIIAYKLGFARELPFKKEILVYIMLMLGVFILTIFNLLGLPITESLIIISLVLGIYRYRLHLTRKRKKEAKDPS